MLRGLVCWSLLLVSMMGCGPSILLGDDGIAGATDVDDDGSGSSGSDGAPPPVTTGTTTMPPGTTAMPTPPDPDDGRIFVETDLGTPLMCDPYLQDCPPGEKCVAFANDGGDDWNAYVCRDVVGDPAGLDESCVMEGSPLSGYDTCGFGAMCWGVDPVTLQGTCVPQCVGSEQEPLCERPGDICVIPDDGVPPLCLPVCDPVLQDCPEDFGCYPAADYFACLPMDPGGTVDPGAPCETHEECTAGALCVAPDLVPDCAGAIGCCTAWCDLWGPMPDAPCLPGQQCTSYFEEGVFPGPRTIGGCIVP